MNSVKTVKMVLVGDSCVGKTSLLFTYVHNRFPEEYVPTVFENHISTLKVDDKIVSLSLWDTAGQQEYAKLLKLSFCNCDVVMVVIDLSQPCTLKNALLNWIPMVEKECPESRIVVVGNKSDLRGLKTSYIPEDYAQSELTEKYPYLECSAKTREGVVQAFEKSIRLVLRKDQKRKSKCHLI